MTKQDSVAAAAHTGGLTKRELPVLATLAELSQPHGEFCVTFDRISGQPRNSSETAEVRRVVRQLARKGYAQFVRGLFDDDGAMCGSGYCITPDGIAALAKAEPQS